MKKIFLMMNLIMCFVLVQAQDQKESEPVKEPMKPALLVIDIKNEYLKYMSDEDKKNGMEMINGAIWIARQSNIPVIRIYHHDPKWGPQPGSESFEFPSSVVIKDTDPKVIKNFPSGFKKTELDGILKEKDCNTLFLCGLSATGCVLATYHGGQDLDYHVFMLKGAIISHNSRLTSAVEDICETVSLDTYMFMLTR